MRKGITINEILILIILLIGVVFAIIPHLIRGRASASMSGARAACTTVMSETETFRMSKGHSPKSASDLLGRLDSGILNAMFDQNPNDALIATDGTGSSAAIRTAYKNVNFIYLVKTNAAPDGTVDPLIRAVMVLPARFYVKEENCYYRTNETGTTYLWSAAWELATNSPKSPADASGQPMYFKPAGPKSMHTSLVYEVNLSSTYFKSGN